MVSTQVADARPRADAEWPLVSVVMVAYNRREAVRVALGKVLHELDYPALEVILIDNASQDGTAGMVAEAFPEARLLRLERNVGAPAWNRGFGLARGRWVLILDDDCYLEGAALKQMVGAGESNRADLVSCRVRSSETAGYFFNDDDPAGLLSFWGCSALVSARALERVGGYDPNIFIWGNEVEFTMRYLDAGFRHLYLPEVVSTHMKARASTSEFNARWHRLTHRHWAYGAGKNLGAGDAARVLARLLVRVALHTAARSPRAAPTLPEVLAGFGRGLRARRPVRPEVSALYRDNWQSFATPLEGVRRRLDRGRGHALGYYEARRGLYPERAAVIEL